MKRRFIRQNNSFIAAIEQRQNNRYATYKIRNFQEVQYLDISANRLTITIPMVIGALCKLSYFAIANISSTMS